MGSLFDDSPNMLRPKHVLVVDDNEKFGIWLCRYQPIEMFQSILQFTLLEI